MSVNIKRLCRQISLSFLVSMVLLPSPLVASAKMLTYLKEYQYQASEVDSKLTCRTIAIEQVKRLLLEELGTYLMSETEVKDFDLTKDRIASLTAGIVSTVILEEKWDGQVYFLKAKISTDTDELVKFIDRIRRDYEQSKNWEEMREKTEKALKEIEQLKKEIGKGDAAKVSQEKYANVVNELNAVDWFKKGYALSHIGIEKIRKNDQEAMKAFDKAIEIDPNYAQAYAARCSIYTEWEQFEKALKESNQAIRLKPNLAWGFNCRGYAHTGLENYKEAIQDYNQALALAPKYVWVYCNRSWTYMRMNKNQQALEDANKAIELAPDFSTAYFRRGRALAALNNFQDAIKDFDQAIELNRGFSWSYFRRGQALLKLNKQDQALGDFKQAARLGNVEAQNYLKRRSIQW